MKKETTSMKILISSIGSRGDVQPMMALALELRALGHDTLLCVPPNFKSWVESYGLVCMPVGSDMQLFIASVQAEFGGGPVQKTQALVRFIRGEIQEQSWLMQRKDAMRLSVGHYRWRAPPLRSCARFLIAMLLTAQRFCRRTSYRRRMIIHSRCRTG
jgi:hypothetical protein